MVADDPKSFSQTLMAVAPSYTKGCLLFASAGGFEVCQRRITAQIASTIPNGPVPARKYVGAGERHPHARRV